MNSTNSSAGKVLRILESVSRHGRAITLAEITEQLNIPKGTAHRLCAQLVEMGFLARDVDERSYGIGKALRGLALNTLTHRSIQGLSHTALTDLVRSEEQT